MNIFSLAGVLIMMLSLNACCKSDDTANNTICTEKCNKVPETGPCNAAFPKYYYNKTTMECDTFIWGGCNGVVPFETLEECIDCGCK